MTGHLSQVRRVDCEEMHRNVLSESIIGQTRFGRKVTKMCMYQSQQTSLDPCWQQTVHLLTIYLPISKDHNFSQMSETLLPRIIFAKDQYSRNYISVWWPLLLFLGFKTVSSQKSYLWVHFLEYFFGCCLHKCFWTIVDCWPLKLSLYTKVVLLRPEIRTFWALIAQCVKIFRFPVRSKVKS